MSKKNLKRTVLAIVAFMLIPVGMFAYVFGPNQLPHTGVNLPADVVEIHDFISTVYLFELSGGKIALIDAGISSDGAPILRALEKLNKTPEDVVAIFITHAHPDHDASVSKFRNAKIYASAREVEIASGRAPYNRFIGKVLGQYNKHPFTVTNPLKDGETVNLGGLEISSFDVPGHTPGSAVYFAKGVLFLGDAASIRRDESIRAPVWFLSTDQDEGISSIRQLVKKLNSRAMEIKFVTSTHSGTVEGQKGMTSLIEFSR